MEKLLEKVRERAVNLDEEVTDSEAGMEAAQVILILILVVIALIPAFTFIRSRIAQRATDAGNGIGSAS